ncbi:MAG: putative 2OG-Fe(II) oxygenase [Erythrobacter sp.]
MLRSQAQTVEREQGAAKALAWLDSELTKGKPSADLWNFAGNVAMRAQQAGDAAMRFGKAAKSDPKSLEYAINHAIALSAHGDNPSALKALHPHEQAGANDQRYCSVRANAARGAGALKEAAHWYDAALRLNPKHLKALNGRARVAIERAEPDALARFDHALTIDSGNADLWLGKAQALDVNGDTAGARIIAQQLVDQAPAWTESLKFMAQLRLGAGEEDFTDHYRTAVDTVPQDPNVLSDWITQLAGLDYANEAADIAAEARLRFPNQLYFTLLEAVNAGAAGDESRAEEIFASLEFGGIDRQLHEARHRIRRKEFDRAETLLDAVIQTEPWSISAWALRGIIWRCTGDGRADWLHEQAGLYCALPLHNAEKVLPAAITKLHELHDNSPLPLGQSLRGGTQTRGNLFDRMEPEFAALKNAILTTAAAYWNDLPDTDFAHPMLRHRKRSLDMLGSWSVRLSGGGDHHTSHIHPQGLVSSALYLEVPEGDATEDEQAGWLEIGRSPADLQLDLPPLAMVEPKPGHLALFPSTLYHGTRPFGAGQRMTVAFDLVSSE